jgi:hypothetical protein
MSSPINKITHHGFPVSTPSVLGIDNDQPRQTALPVSRYIFTTSRSSHVSSAQIVCSTGQKGMESIGKPPNRSRKKSRWVALSQKDEAPPRSGSPALQSRRSLALCCFVRRVTDVVGPKDVGSRAMAISSRAAWMMSERCER